MLSLTAATPLFTPTAKLKKMGIFKSRPLISETCPILKASTTSNSVNRSVGSINHELQAVKRKLAKRQDLEFIDVTCANQLTDFAELLSDKDKMKERWFEHLLQVAERATELVQKEAEDFEEGYDNDEERGAAQERLAEQLTSDRRTLEVKLLLYELGTDDGAMRTAAKAFHRYWRGFTYGPFHAALQIGDVILGWDNGNLVIPEIVTTDPDTQPGPYQRIFAASVHDHSSQPASPVILDKMPLRAGAEKAQEMFDKQIKKVGEIRWEQRSLIDEIINVVIKYNTKCHYGMFSRNCQKFVSDILMVLGITDQAKIFKGKLEAHSEILRRRGDAQAKEFNSHQDLDVYVKAQLDLGDIDDEDDIYFCHCHYLLFHAWHQKSPDTPAWQCDPRTCQSEHIGNLVSLPD